MARKKHPRESSKFRDIEYRRLIIARLYHRGIRLQTEIYEKLKSEYGMTISQPTISRDLSVLQKRWENAADVNIEKAKAEIISEILELKREYWKSWKKSQEKSVTRKTETSEDGIEKITEIVQYTVGNKQFLDGVEWCIDRIVKIYGLDAPQKHEIVDWRREMEDAGLSPSEIFNEMVEKFVNELETKIPENEQD